MQDSQDTASQLERFVSGLWVQRFLPCLMSDAASCCPPLCGSQRLVTDPHGATDAATTSQMFGSSNSYRHHGTAPSNTHTTSGTPADFISRDKYPLSPRSNAAFLAIASEFDPPHSPEVAVIFESCELEQVTGTAVCNSVCELYNAPCRVLFPKSSSRHSQIEHQQACICQERVCLRSTIFSQPTDPTKSEIVNGKVITYVHRGSRRSKAAPQSPECQ